jgi:hypothetical protein
MTRRRFNCYPLAITNCVLLQRDGASSQARHTLRISLRHCFTPSMTSCKGWCVVAGSTHPTDFAASLFHSFDDKLLPACLRGNWRPAGLEARAEHRVMASGGSRAAGARRGRRLAPNVPKVDGGLRKGRSARRAGGRIWVFGDGLSDYSGGGEEIRQILGDSRTDSASSQDRIG